MADLSRQLFTDGNSAVLTLRGNTAALFFYEPSVLCFIEPGVRCVLKQHEEIEIELASAGALCSKLLIDYS
jgi:hypothetical protein